ncbi:MAG: hypothetical protein ACK5PZ_03260, partial [Pirellula sp.]
MSAPEKSGDGYPFAGQMGYSGRRRSYSEKKKSVLRTLVRFQVFYSSQVFYPTYFVFFFTYLVFCQ